MAIRGNASGTKCTSPSYSPSVPVTVMCWYYMTTIDFSAFPFFVGCSGPTNGWTAGGNVGPVWSIMDDAGNSYNAASGPSLNTWYHIALVIRSGASNNLEMWVNGTQVVVASAAAVSGITNIRIGTSSNTDAAMTGLKAWNAALTGDEIKAEMSAMRPMRAGCVLWAPMIVDENGSSWRDLSGNGRTMTESAAITWTTVDGPAVPWGGSPLVTLAPPATAPAAPNDGGTFQLRKEAGKSGLRGGATLRGPSGTLYTMTLTESVTAAEVIARADSKPLTESVSLSESLLRSLARSLSETVTSTESLALVRLYLRTLSETLTLTEARTQQTGRTLAETTSLTETFAKVSTLLRTLTDTASLADVRAFQTRRTLADGVTLTDTMQASAVLQKILSESLALTEALSRAVGMVRADGVTLTEARTFGTSRTLTETATLTDSTTRAMQRALAEAVSMADTLTSLKLFVRTLTEALTLTDTRVDAIGKQLADAVTLTEALAHQATLARTLSESLGLADVLARQDRKTFSETASLTEFRAFSAARILSEAVTLNELTRKLAIGRALLEAVTADDAAMSRALYRTLGDTLALVDSVVAGILTNAFAALSRTRSKCLLAETSAALKLGAPRAVSTLPETASALRLVARAKAMNLPTEARLAA